ncbi:MAG: thioredoxin domain-containing protein, partial [bacterium]
YLLQHADNPVDWYPWGPEAFEKAKRENKPIFLSIGYSTCHWCHVMERESFSDPDVAALMNETFVCVKVDREERPDIDHLYMTTCQLLTGSGGWPLTIVMTPDRRPFFAGTYFPRDNRYGRPGMLEIVPRIRDLWRNERESLNETASQIAEGLHAFLSPDQTASPAPDISDRVFALLTQQYDTRHGGFGSAPKFPVFSNILFLLNYWSRSGNEQALDMVLQTLRSMRRGGIYDHLGYGMHRYSTDERWFAPHFEKMLYDQALAVLSWTESFRATGEDHFRKVTEEILSYVLRDLTSADGGFYSAEDADSEGEEGRFYTWTAGELEKTLDEEEQRVVHAVYNTSVTGNFFTETGRPTGRNILALNSGVADLSGRLGMGPEQLEEALRRIRKKLMDARDSRPRPSRDEKIMTDWNGLMIAALAKAGAASGEASYVLAAERALSSILDSGDAGTAGLAHIRYSREQSVPAFLDDFAYLLWGVLELHQATFRNELLKTALDLASEMAGLFEDGDRGGFFLNRPGSDSSLAGIKPSFDGPIPSGNAVAAMTLLRLGRLTGRKELEDQANGIFGAFASEMMSNPAGFAYMACAHDLAQNGTAEVVIIGKPEEGDTKRLIHALHRSFLPFVTAAVVDPGNPDPIITDLLPYASDMRLVEGKAAAYICRDFACQAPISDPAEMLRALSGRRLTGT